MLVSRLIDHRMVILRYPGSVMPINARTLRYDPLRTTTRWLLLDLSAEGDRQTSRSSISHQPRSRPKHWHNPNSKWRGQVHDPSISPILYRGLMWLQESTSHHASMPWWTESETRAKIFTDLIHSLRSAVTSKETFCELL